MAETGGQAGARHSCYETPFPAPKAREVRFWSFEPATSRRCPMISSIPVFRDFRPAPLYEPTTSPCESPLSVPRLRFTRNRAAADIGSNQLLVVRLMHQTKRSAQPLVNSCSELS